MSQSSKDMTKSLRKKKQKYNFQTLSTECQGSRYYLDPQLY